MASAAEVELDLEAPLSPCLAPLGGIVESSEKLVPEPSRHPNCKTVTPRVESSDAWWPTSGVEIRVVITRDPKVRRRICHMSSTDLRTSPAEIVQAFPMRWSIEETGADAKLETGLDSAQVRKADSACRHAALAFAFVTIVRLWSLRKSARRKNPPASLRRQLAPLGEDTIMQTLFSSIPGSGRSRKKVAEVAKLVATRS